jgi:YesN/AraC family two-component response regulator
MTRNEIISNSEVFEQYLYDEEFRVCCVEASQEFEAGENYIYLNGVGDQGVFILKESNLGLLIKNELKFMNAGISAMHKGIFSLKTAYEEALYMRQKAFCTGEPGLFFDEEREEKKERIIVSEKFITPESKLRRVQLLGTDKTEEIADQWNKIFREVRKGRLSWKLFEELTLDFLEETQKTYRNIIQEETEKPMELKHILKYNNITTYEEKFMEWTLELHEKINSQFAVNKNKQKINQAIQYINKNYAKDLNMAVVSNYISMNYSLFSYSFKQYTGSNFVDYLKNIRISEAKRLLKETDMRINEISQAIGYDNEKHFMKMFKSTCGVSPSEYRKNMQH